MCRSCGSGAGPLRSEGEASAHVRARHAAAAARCACGALLAGPRYRCPAPACTHTFAVQYLLERHMHTHHTPPNHQVSSNMLLYF